MADFSDLRRFRDPDLKWLFAQLDQRDLVVALKGADEELTQRIWANVSHQVGTFLERELSRLDDVDDGQVQAARQLIGVVIDTGLRTGAIAFDAQSAAPFRRIDNPYITGNPVRGDKVFFGREDDLAYVEQRLRAERDGIVLLFVGGRRSGKTSIMFKILDGRLGDEFLPVFIDMQGLHGIHGDGQMLGRIARAVIEGLGDERLVVDYYDFASGNPILTFDRLLKDVDEILPGHRLLFLVDEAEILRNKVAAGEVTSSVLTYMAAILESRRVSYFFTGSAGLAEADVAEWRRLMGKGDFREISFLSPTDTARLVREPVAGSVTYAEGVVEAIHQLTYGHPFYTQLICTNAVDHLNNAQRRHLTRDDLDEVVRTIVNNPPPQLVYDWDQFSPSEQLALSLLSEASESAHTPVLPPRLLQAIEDNGYPIDLSAESLHVVLDGLDKKMVLERSEGGGYHFLVDLVRLWIRRSRSVWHLVEEQGAVARARPRWVVPAAAAVVVAMAAVTWVVLSGRDQPGAATAVPLGPRTGSIWLGEYRRGTVAEVLGPLDGDAVPLRETRETPTVFQERQPGQYQVTLSHELYATRVETLRVVAGQMDTVDTLRSPLTRLTGRLSVVPVQAGARVRVYSAVESVDTTATGALEDFLLHTGTYRVEVSLSGHLPWTREVEVAAGDTLPLTPDLAADLGNLYVQSDPPGAALFVDGSPAGTTPARVPGLAVGRHQVRLEQRDYQTVDTAQAVRYQRTDTLTVTLVLKPAVLTINSTPPGATIAIDGVTLADTVTPARITRPPGAYRLRVELPGYDVLEESLSLAPGETRPLRVDLAQQFGWLQVVRPVSGTLLVDGKERKKGLLKIIQLPVGRCVLQLEGDMETQQVDIPKGDTIRVSFGARP